MKRSINVIIIILGFPGLCSCCPPSTKSTNGVTTSHSPKSGALGSVSSSSSSPVSPTTSTSTTSTCLSDPRQLSVAELRRKAHEHSAALLHSLHAASLAFPGLPSLSLHSVLNNSRKTNDFINDLSMHHHLHNNNNNIQNNNNTLLENTPNLNSEEKTSVG